MTLLKIFRQDERPSYHSYFVLLSHFGYAWSIYITKRLKLYPEFVNFLVMTIISLNYHACDEKIACLGMDFEGWHFLDVYYTFHTIMTLTFFICEIGDHQMRFILTNIYCTLSAALIHKYRFTVEANMILWLLPVIFFLYNVVFKKNYVKYHIKTLIKITVLLILSVLFFILGNYTGFNQDEGEIRELRSPTVPDTDFYWLFHSLWHIFSQIAIGLIILEKKNDKIKIF